MILRQLINTGRHFCECRSRDFIPESEDRITVIAYSIHDTIEAKSFDRDNFRLESEIKTWLEGFSAIGYLLINREPANLHPELPFPISHAPIDRVTIIAATAEGYRQAVYSIEWQADFQTCRLQEVEHPNIIRQPQGLHELMWRSRGEDRQADQAWLFELEDLRVGA